MLRKRFMALMLATGLVFGGATFYGNGITAFAEDGDAGSSDTSTSGSDSSESDTGSDSRGTVTIIISYDSGTSSSGSSSSSSGSGGSSSTLGSDAYLAGHGNSTAVYVMTKPGTVRYEETRVGKKAKSVKIPDTVKAGGDVCKVTDIATYAISGAYSGYDRLSSVEVGKYVTRIRSSAFEGAPKLKTLRIHSKKLTKRACYDCLVGSAVKTVIVPEKKLAAYRKVFAESNCGKKVTVKVE